MCEKSVKSLPFYLLFSLFVLNFTRKVIHINKARRAKMQSIAAFTTTTATRATSSAFASGSTRRGTTRHKNKNTNIIIPGVKLFSTTAQLRSSKTKTKITKTKIIRSMSPMPDADEDEGSVLDLPEEYVRAVPSRRPDIFPDLQEIKQPMPNPLPGDPEMPDEEEEERKGKKIRENQEKTRRKTKTERKSRRKRKRGERRRRENEE